MPQETISNGNYVHKFEAFAGKTAERLDLSQVASLTQAPTTTDSFTPEDLKIVDVGSCKTTKFRARNADELKRMVRDSRLDRVVERDQVVDYTSYPFCCSGKLFVGANSNFSAPLWTGSAALVGRNLLLTASHCAPWADSGTGAMTGWWMRFVPAYKNGSEPFGSSYVSDFRGVRNTDNVVGVDYVICRLYKPLGDRCGWLGSSWWGNNANYMPPNSWFSVGYPGDAMNGQVMMVERGVQLHQVDTEGATGRELEAHTFSTPGWSGGPMFGIVTGQQRCIGVMSGKEFENDSLTGVFSGTHWHSVTAGGKAMVDLIVYGQTNWS
ncbi:trypsin-like serine peptidase [Aspergillus lucknowensis]|uniref:Trypsin-like cysteine/serine peptidase domain-containing protein n=1 Tax=Aspergillus lucknowensis TaxID=176173 RepID=A0ABR4LJR9_9EURO